MTTFLIGLLTLLGFIAFWVISTYNKLVYSKNIVDEAWSGIDIQLKRRSNLVTNLVAVVKEYSIHEKSTLENVTQLRLAAMGSSSVAEKASAEAGLTGALKTLFAVSENYPNLKANENFLSLQKQLATLEEEIQLSRRYYNGAARNYNIVITTFPSRVVARVTDYKKIPYFQLKEEHEREVPKVKF